MIAIFNPVVLLANSPAGHRGRMTLDNLLRLRLLAEQQPDALEPSTPRSQHDSYPHLPGVRVTAFGAAFYFACQPPENCD
jgi:hypothetical protein